MNYISVSAVQNTLEYFSSRLVFRSYAMLFFLFLVFLVYSSCFFGVLGVKIPCFLQLRLPFAVGNVPATAVAYCQGAGECQGALYQVIRSLAVWWPPSPGPMLSPGGAASPEDCPEYLAMPVVR